MRSPFGYQEQRALTEVLGQFCPAALRIMETTIAEKNREEEEAQSGCFWSLMQVVLGKDTAKLFIFVAERSLVR